MKKSLFKNKIQMVIYSIIFIGCIILFILIGQIDFQKDVDSEAKKFSQIYNLVDNDNVFVFSNATEVLNILNGRSGIVLFGFPTNKWVNYTASVLNEVAKELNISKIYYYDFLKDRDESNGTYETIVNKLKTYVLVNDEGVSDILAPTILIVKNGMVLGYIDDTSIIRGPLTPEEYYSDTERSLVKDKIKNILLNYLN